MPSFTALLPYAVLAAQISTSSAHMSPYMSSMYGMYTDIPNFSPIGPDWSFDDWWFRGPSTRASPPAAGAVSHLPAGGSLTLEIACNIAFSTLGGNAGNTVACPGNNGAYHSGDPAAATVDYSLLGGCALAISDTTDIAAVTKDNLAVFSVQKECVWQRNTVFNVPAAMPPCTGAYCICAWLWEPQNGTGNYYQTPFRCDVTGSPIGATPIQTPLVDPTYCGDGSACTTGAKRPIFYYNLDYSNVVWQGNYLRPGYHATWSFNDGAQNDIFMSSAQAAVYKPTVASTSAAPAATTYPKSTDLAIGATASASSVAAGSPASAANDGVIGGYYNTNGADTGNDAAEWSSNGEGVGAWLLLTWTNAVTISQVVVYDRPNLDDHCLAFTLTFGDGSVQTFGNMNNDGSATAVTIATISTSTLKWTCTAVSAHTSNVGLSEFQVYAAANGVAVSSSASLASASSSASVATSAAVVTSSSSAPVRPVASSSTVTSATTASSVVVKTSAPASSAVVKTSASSPATSAKPSSSSSSSKTTSPVATPTKRKGGRSRLISKAKREQEVAREAAARRASLWTKKVHESGDI